MDSVSQPTDGFRGLRRIVPAHDIDAEFVPRPVEGTLTVVVGDESVILNGWRTATVLNATAALIWERLDGRASVGQMAARLAAAEGVPADLVLAEVLDVVRNVGAIGLLEDVPPPDGLVVTAEPIPRPVAGDTVDNLGLSDLDDDSWALHDLLGQETVLVNWNPHCGHCAGIAGRLADVRAALAAADVGLVLLAYGDAASNRALAEQAGLHTRILLHSPATDPFRGAGTPSAFHLDGTGRLLSDPAYGAGDVMALVERLAGTEQATGRSSGQTGESAGRIRYLLDRGAMCAPGAGESAPVRWAGTRVYRMGQHHVGIRHDTGSTADVLDRLFAGRRVDDPRAGHSFSVALGPLIERFDESALEAVKPDRRTRGLSMLGENGRPPVRSRHPARVLRALLWRLDDEIGDTECPEGHIRANAIAVVSDRGAALLPVNFHAFAPRLQPMLARAGFALADVALPEIDLSTAELVIRAPTIDHERLVFNDAALAAGVQSEALTSIEQPPVLPGRYPLIGWCAITPGEQPVVHHSPASAAAAVMSTVEGAIDPTARLVQLADLFTRVPGYGLWYHSEAELVAAISTALG